MRRTLLYNMQQTSIAQSRQSQKKARNVSGQFCLCIERQNLRNGFMWTHFLRKPLTSNNFLCFQIANNPCANLLTAHFRLDGHPNVNYLEKVIQSSAQSYLFFEPSQVAFNEWILLRSKFSKINFSLPLFRTGWSSFTCSRSQTLTWKRSSSIVSSNVWSRQDMSWAGNCAAWSQTPQVCLRW